MTYRNACATIFVLIGMILMTKSHYAEGALMGCAALLSYDPTGEEL